MDTSSATPPPDGPAAPLAAAFTVGVAVYGPDPSEPSVTTRGMRQYDEGESSRGWRRQIVDRTQIVIQEGDQAVRAATEAIATQIALTAQRIATTVEQQAVVNPAHGQLGMDTVEVSFGITLTGGVQALFTAQAESSAQVTITLTRNR